MDVCTDDAPEMLGSRSGFVVRIKQRSVNTVGTHCVIFRGSCLEDFTYYNE